VQQYDAVIVGGGHNGLVCAAYLGKAGLKVAVIERRPIVGGAAVTEEVWPGFHVSVASYWMSLLQPKIVMDLDLRRHGIEVIPTPPGFQPFEDGRSLVFWSDTQKMVQEIRRFSDEDAEAYPRYLAHIESLLPYLRRLLFETPIDPTTGQLKDISKAIGFAWRFRNIGSHFYDIWDLLTLSAVEYLKRWFRSEAVLTAFGCYASGSGGSISPKSPGSAYVLARPFIRDPNTAAGPGGLVRGGMGSISQALARAAEEAGVTILTNRTVKSIDIIEGTARGVILQDGEVIGAKVVVCNASARLLFLEMIDPSWLKPEVIDAVKRIRIESTCFKINLATTALPRWSAYDARGLQDRNPGSVTTAENLEELEEAFQAAMQGGISPRPYMWLITPSGFDPNVAPPGKHFVSILGGHVPYKLKGREWDDAAHDELYDIVMRQICRYAPGFDACVLHRQVLAPPDIERIFALPGGHVHHGELTLDQVFFRRPIAGFANYRTPIANLYMCGASTHPGGGVTGVPGHNAAREVLWDAGRQRAAKAMRYA
jgi:phytoene dehydrogenase-like protein